jgi:hypothetical protein
VLGALNERQRLAPCRSSPLLLKDRLGDQRGGSEWEPIKIDLKNMNSNMSQNQLQIRAHMMEM